MNLKRLLYFHITAILTSVVMVSKKIVFLFLETTFKHTTMTFFVSDRHYFVG